MLTVISITAIMAAIAYPLYFVCRKNISAPPLPLSLVVALAGALEFFDLMAIHGPEHLLFWKKFSLTTEAFLPPLWLWFSLTYARQREPRLVPVFLRLMLAASPLFAACAIFIPVDSFFYSPHFASERMLFLGNSGLYFYAMIVLYLTVALINLEQTLTHANLSTRWKIKFELLGAGAILAVLILYYSQALLFRTLNVHLVPARAAILTIALAMMAYSRLKRGTNATVYVSHRIVYQSMVLFVVGAYLIGLGLVGEGMKHFGDAFQYVLAFVLVFLTGLGLLVTMLSEQVKRRINVYIQKNFYRNKYEYRIQWLQFTDRLSSSQTREWLLHSIVRGFCDTFGMCNGMLFLLKQEHGTYHQVIGIGMDISPIAIDVNDPLLMCVAGKGWILDLRDKIAKIGNSRQLELFKDVEACFIIPLLISNAIDGFIVLGRPINKHEIYNYEDFDLMRVLAKQASSALLNLRLSDQLAYSREMAAIGKISTFVMHDLKNLVSAVSLVLENAQDYITLPAFQKELLATLMNTVNKMNALVSRLKHLPEKDTLQHSSVDLLQMAHETAALVKWSEFRVIGTHVIADIDREEIQKVALNLVLNAVEASEDRKPVIIEVGENNAPYFRVKDEGCGIPEDFLRDALFTPFSSTKKKGLGIGLYQSKQIVEAHGGKIEVRSEVNRGSEFTVWLPKFQPGASSS